PLYFTDTTTSQLYTLSLHDALPICPPQTHGPPLSGDGRRGSEVAGGFQSSGRDRGGCDPMSSFLYAFDATTSVATITLNRPERLDRKSTRLNSSHVATSYAGFCLKK